VHNIEVTVIVFQSEIHIVDFTPVKAVLIGERCLPLIHTDLQLGGISLR
jgi:hypothetical protein